MNLRTLIINKNKTAREFITTDQYKISRKMISERNKLGLTAPEASDILNISLENYVNLEFGDISISVDSYNTYLNKLINYSHERSFSIVVDSLNSYKVAINVLKNVKGVLGIAEVLSVANVIKEENSECFLISKKYTKKYTKKYASIYETGYTSSKRKDSNPISSYEISEMRLV